MTLPTSPRLIDFHSHYYEAAWYPSATPRGPGVLIQAWPLLTDIEAQLEAMEEAGIDAKVLSAPAGALVPSNELVPLALMERINERFAALIAEHPEHLLGLATIDALQGQVAVREMERAIHTLGLTGICVDCARKGCYLDAPEARPVLEAAAALNVAVFVHPVSPSGLTERLSPLGHTGILLARGTETAASILAMIRGGIFDALPNLKIGIPSIAAAALIFAGIADQDYGREENWHATPPSLARKNLYVDTMGFDPATIRFAVELLGPEHVLLGSDWPIMPITPRQRVVEVLEAAGLSDGQQEVVMGGNTLHLLRQDADT